MQRSYNQMDNNKVVTEEVAAVVAAANWSG